MKGDKEMDKIIKKVNEYAKLSKERELTEEEKKIEINIENYIWINSVKQ